MKDKPPKIKKINNKDKIPCYNCSETGLVGFRKLNKETKIHENVTVSCVICNGLGYEIR